jgi:putative DNA primase/helicase
VPARDVPGTLWSLQTIAADGRKLWIPKSRTAGCYFAIGHLQPGARLLVCEGFATGATLHEATGDAVAVAFTAGNLLRVAQALREKYPEAALTIAADDDHATKGNPGLTLATKAARAVGALLAVPDFTGLARGAHHTDFNDQARLTARETSAS